MTATTRRGVRVPDPLWTKALELARANDTTVTAIVIRALQDYTNQNAAS